MKSCCLHALRVMLKAMLMAGLPWLAIVAIVVSAPASARPVDFSFGAIGQAINIPNEDSTLEQAITESDAGNLAFIVANGFKRADEPCTDELYRHRLNLLESAKNGLIVSLAAGDWSECKDTSGRSTAVERLSRLRELFFADEFSLGASKIPVMRQSSAPKFRSYLENARWEIDNILFATINLPSDNNHYRMEAGRNSEFEDRLIANRNWLQRTFSIATSKKMAGIVLFCDANPFLKPAPRHLFDSSGKRDGFAEIRQQLGMLANKFPGKVLIVHNQSGSSRAHSGDIAWHGNLGDLELGADWIKLSVKVGNKVGNKVGSPAMFTASRGSLDARAPSQ
ncbi:MAG: hypothetical protein ACHP7O_09170 [Burkholderiales bacterium]